MEENTWEEYKLKDAIQFLRSIKENKFHRIDFLYQQLYNEFRRENHYPVNITNCAIRMKVFELLSEFRYKIKLTHHDEAFILKCKIQEAFSKFINHDYSFSVIPRSELVRLFIEEMTHDEISIDKIQKELLDSYDVKEKLVS